MESPKPTNPEAQKTEPDDLVPMPMPVPVSVPVPAVLASSPQDDDRIRAKTQSKPLPTAEAMTEESPSPIAIPTASTGIQTGKSRGVASDPTHGQHEGVVMVQQMNEPQHRQQEAIPQVYPDNDSAADLVGMDDDEYELEEDAQNDRVCLL